MLSRSSFGGTPVRRLAIAMSCVINASIWAQSHPAGRSRDTNKQMDRADDRSLSDPTLRADSTAGWWLTAESQTGTLIWQNPFAQLDDDALHLPPVAPVRPPDADRQPDGWPMSSDIDGWPMSSDVGEDGWPMSSDVDGWPMSSDVDGWPMSSDVGEEDGLPAPSDVDGWPGPSDVGREGFGALPAGFWYDREKEALYAFIGGYSLGDALDDLEAYSEVDVDQLIASQPLLLDVLREYGTTPGGGSWVEAGDEFLDDRAAARASNVRAPEDPDDPPPDSRAPEPIPLPPDPLEQCWAWLGLVGCNDGNQCTLDRCVSDGTEMGGFCTHTPLSGAPCDDGDPCTVGDQCVWRSCLGGSEFDCDDGDPCTNDVCACPEGAPDCTPTCYNVPMVCEDHEDPCTYGACEDGVCVFLPGSGSPCADDGDPCTDDVCNGGACTHPPVSGACADDGNPCTDDVCNGGVCTHPPISGLCADDGNPCTYDFCANGDCTHPPNMGPCADDGNPCTNDWCNNGACTHPATSGPCADDGNQCTDDVCSGGACTHPPISGPACADDGNPCTDDFCIDGACSHPGTSGPCTDDGNACTDDRCSGGACTHPPNSDPCDDGNPCTENDACSGGTCAGTQTDCDDGNPCTDDVCQFGICSRLPNGNPACDDDPPCPGGCDDDNECTVDSCENATCTQTPRTGSCDDGDACTENDTCSNGACVGTAVDCDDGNPCTINDRCEPEVGCVSEELCDDGDPCTIDSCDPGTLLCEHEEMWDPPLDTCEPQGCVIAMVVPERLLVNNDDDNGNGIADTNESGPIIGEDDLQGLTLEASGCPEACGNVWALGLTSPHQCFSGSDKTGPLSRFSQSWPPPTAVWIEGTRATSVCGEPTNLFIDKGGGLRKSCCVVASQPILVVRVASVVWEKADPTNLDLGTCDNNGGRSIFPGKTSPQDQNPQLRNQVDLVATITPPISGVPVYFQVWDVDDPFDQIHGPGGANDVPNVNLIDNDTSGPDNRPVGEAPQTFSVPTGADGKARVTLTVSMQPGNNYRAAASCIEDVFGGTGAQVDQTDADAKQSDHSGDWSGYEVPAVWSKMLTVWRKLHVEVDSMGTVSGNSATGTIVSVTTEPSAPEVQFEITDLPDDFEDEDHFHLGQASIAGFGVFRTVASIKGILFDDYVTIANPGAVDFTGAVGANYTLEDDDIGGVLGFPAPPVNFPILPDTGLMDTVYARAYLVVDRLTSPDVSQTNLAFSRNLLTEGEAYAFIEGSKNIDSSAAYWVVHVVSACQGYSNRDGDHDREEEVSGLLYGLTKSGFFSRGGSLVFLESCRDMGRTEPTIGELVRFTVAHEVGHQFELEHEDGTEDSPGSGTYLMNTSPHEVFPDNLWFSANSLNKIRSLPYPQDE